MQGYNEMLRKIKPSAIICYGKPFDEMKGKIIEVDYAEVNNLNKIFQHDRPISLGPAQYDSKTDTYLKRVRGFICTDKGMGSASGGGNKPSEWKPNPNKPDDSRFLGTPGEMKETIVKNGDKYRTKIGENGRAVRERHYTTHNREHTGHTNPHDHEINWDKGYPELGQGRQYPNGDAPEFKGFVSNKSFIGGETIMGKDLNYGFESEKDFRFCMECGGEVEFVWKNKTYDIVHDPDGVVIYEAHSPDESKYKTTDELLEHFIGSDKLKEIITKIDVIVRNI